jgi:type IV secretion system protein TrbI
MSLPFVLWCHGIQGWRHRSRVADNVVLSRRPTHQNPSSVPGTDPLAGYPVLPTPSDSRPSSATAAPIVGQAPPTAAQALDSGPSALDGQKHRLTEGTAIDTVLLNRLDGMFSGNLNCLVTTPVYSHSRQHVVIPVGARVLGTATPVQAWGESRLAVRFHRLLMPDGRSYSLDKFAGLNQAGDVGLKDQVNRHYFQVFGASLAIGALSGLAQLQTRGGADPEYGFSDGYRQGLGGSLASSAGRVLDRFLNILPTVTIREGHRVKVYLTSDLELPEYRS